MVLECWLGPSIGVAGEKKKWSCERSWEECAWLFLSRPLQMVMWLGEALHVQEYVSFTFSKVGKLVIMVGYAKRPTFQSSHSQLSPWPSLFSPTQGSKGTEISHQGKYCTITTDNNNSQPIPEKYQPGVSLIQDTKNLKSFHQKISIQNLFFLFLGLI